MGVVTAINSDDAEMARRLNQEAAKAVKYGGVSQEEAWKMVTLNPAKLLHLDHRVGSIKSAKMPISYFGLTIPYRFMQKYNKPMSMGVVTLMLKKT